MRSFKIPDELPASSKWSEKFVSRLRNQDYRHAYMAEGVRNWIARQVRLLREQRGWSQEQLGQETDKPQSAISRIEDPDYGKLTLQTLFDLAEAFDLPLLVQFANWGDWLERMDDVSAEAMQRESFDGDRLSAISTPQYTTLSFKPISVAGYMADNSSLIFAPRCGRKIHSYWSSGVELIEEPELDPGFPINTGFINVGFGHG
jgi:transcriptional regulator with XRE-family HTH domain